MNNTSPQITFDSRLLAIEELLKQRKHNFAGEEIELLNGDEFKPDTPESGLYLLLKSDLYLFQGIYRKALDCGLKSAKILADHPLNRRYGRVQLILSKVYFSLGDLRNSEIRARDSLAAYRRASEKTGQIDALNQLAGISHIRCNYNDSVTHLNEAQMMIDNDHRKIAQLRGNKGMTQIRTGHWEEAEENLNYAIEYNLDKNQEITLVKNYLASGYLHLRKRHFLLAGRHMDKALEIISRLSLKREKVIYLEYAGELAFEKGDLYKAKALLSDAYQKGVLLAPESALVSQSSRRLAEVELELDNVDEAMKYGQKALELATMLGEKLEIGLSERIISRVFAAKEDKAEAVSHIKTAVDQVRQIDEPYELARTILIMAEIKSKFNLENINNVNMLLKEASKIFKSLNSDYWIAESYFIIGMTSCSQGDLASGFRKLSRAEKIFSKIEEKNKLKEVARFLKKLSEQAVALSISQDNQYKLFGNLFTAEEISDIESNQIEDVLSILAKKTRGGRAVLYAPDSSTLPVICSKNLSPSAESNFKENFSKLMDEEVSRLKPTIILDSRRDPFINALFDDGSVSVTSVIVVPFRLSNYGTCYLYLDRLSPENILDPFCQEELNFAVGYTDLIAFKWTEKLKNKLLEDNRRLKSELQQKSSFPNFITQDAILLGILKQAEQVVDSNISISIEGETGSGKDLLARAIHYNSLRRDYRFISVNCAALPETLLESELFGYKRGAFTGADRDKPGLFEEADKGTFFLDEIADMPLSIQAKILRVLESQDITRLGETESRKVDVRIVSATNKNLEVEMSKGNFRQDLYYRLAAFCFKLPSLRERKNDITLLTAHYMEGTGKKLSDEIQKRFETYSWPGNVRELENEIKRLVLLAGDSEEINESLLSGKFLNGNGSPNGNGHGHNSAMPVAVPVNDMEFNDSYSLYDYLSEHEKQFILKALREKKGVKKHAASMLNIPESTLRLKIKQYNIDLNQLSN